jgi:predicted metal-dependent hydrolase
MDPCSYDSRYIEGIDCFNRQAYFEAHEVWEAVWMEQAGTAKDFYKGLIQVAVCLHHFRNGNTRGARKLCLSSRRYLEPYPSPYLGIDVRRLLSDMQRCCAELLTSQEETPPARFPAESLPKLALTD